MKRLLTLMGVLGVVVCFSVVHAGKTHTTPGGRGGSGKSADSGSSFHGGLKDKGKALQGAKTKRVGHYEFNYDPSAEWVVNAIEPYAGKAFDVPAKLLGASKKDYKQPIKVHVSEVENNTPSEWNRGKAKYWGGTIELNVEISRSSDGKKVVRDPATSAALLSHETTHAIVDKDAKLASAVNKGLATNQSRGWLTEALAFYVSNIAFPGVVDANPTKNRAWLFQNVYPGSWNDMWTSYDKKPSGAWVGTRNIPELTAVGLFLAEQKDAKGKSKLQTLIDIMGDKKRESFDDAFRQAYGKSTGGNSTQIGNYTLYSDWITWLNGRRSGASQSYQSLAFRDSSTPQRGALVASLKGTSKNASNEGPKADKQAKEKSEKAAKAAKEKAEKEAKAAKEKAEKEAKERAKAEKEAKERAEKAAKEAKAKAEKAAKEAKEKAEKAAKAAKEKAEKEAKERAKAEKEAKEKAEKAAKQAKAKKR